MPDIYLPNIIKLELTNFSLYCEQSVVMDFSKPVSCLMGANGIGKSTLLNCVNFAITGRINPTNKKLKSIDTLDRGNNYYLQYFDGRISEVDKDYASTRIVFMLGNKRIEVVRNFFPDNTVKREQIVDATHPVDIKVTWPAINNVALIEVKWLGDSGQTQYRDARANEGAKQLIDYLASSVQEEPDKHFVGYLTVFDGRRGKTSNQYERQEINYRSEYSSHPSMNYRRFYMAECV